MKHISQRQGGMTALGIFIIVAMIACFVTFGLRLFPIYNEYTLVKAAMESVLKQPPAKRKTAKDVRKIFLRNVEINGVEKFTDFNIKEFVNVKKSKNGKKKYLHVKYQSSNKLVKNIHLMMDVDETIELTGKAPE